MRAPNSTACTRPRSPAPGNCRRTRSGTNTAARTPHAAPPPAPAVQPEAPHIRYMHPSNRALTWSGEGTMPDWINAWLVTGGTLYALEIAAEKLAPKPIPDSFKLR